MSRKEEQSYHDILASLQIKDEIGRRLVLQSILDLGFDQNQLEGALTPEQIQRIKQQRKKEGQRSSMSADRRTIENIRDRNRIQRDLRQEKGLLEIEEQQGNFAQQLDKGRLFRSYTYYEPEKYRLLGYSKYGKPIFKMSDVFLTSDPIMRSIIDKQFNEIIYGRSSASKLETGDISKKSEKNYDLERIIQTWEKKQYEDFTANKRNQVNESELEEIVVNRGDSKNNYWIYKTGERNGMTWGQIFNGKPLSKQGKISENGNKTQLINNYLAHNKFKDNMNRIVSRMKLQYANIQQFEESDEGIEYQEEKEKQQIEEKKAEQEKQKQKQAMQEQQIEEKDENDENKEKENDEEQEEDEQEEEAEEQDDQNEEGEDKSAEQYEKYQKFYDDFKKNQIENKQKLNKETKPQQKEKEAQMVKEKQVMILDDFQGPYPQPPQQNIPPENNNKEFIKYWGEEPILASKLKLKSTDSSNGLRYRLIEEQPVQETNITQNNKNIPGLKIKRNRNIVEQEKSLVEQIIKQYSLINRNLVKDVFRGKQSLEEYNRIEFHLENPSFFLSKLHFVLQKKSQQFQNFVQGGVFQGQLDLNRNLSNPSAVNRDRSMISGSRGTGGQGTLRMNNPDTIGMVDQDHETIQQKILKQMNHHSKKPITHSEVATKLMFIKFSTAPEQFSLYHRYEFKYEVYFNKLVSVSLLRHPKPIKNKLSELNINMEKIDSHKKFNRPQALSLASEQLKEFILIEYIEENPLLMSDIGMCQRMVIQVNNHEMLHKINNDIINNQEDIDIQEMEERRDKLRGSMNVSTERKMELWRKNIKQEFGENGKVYLWEPKRESKVIGNPDGLGVAMMESNLGITPVVKKKPKDINTDFLLVRQGNRWVLRKIDAVYVSGQVQPKQVVFTPDNRHYQSFLENYQRDYIKRYAIKNSEHKIMIDEVKRFFPNTINTSAESRLRKILKNKMKATTKDNKVYQIPIEEGQITYLIKPEDYCLYQRMQKSLCQLAAAGISSMKNMEKMKSILRKYFKQQMGDLQKFAVARMIRDQLQLTSWYLTQSFYKFMERKARIEMYGHADPTNGHGGYSYIKKPQKERTDKDESQKKEEKQKLSGTQFDLRKLKAENSIQFLLSKGYSREEVEKKSRWELVSYIKKQKNTEYARKERETKEQKEENERKQRSKLFNTLLRNLKLSDDGNDEFGGVVIEPYEYQFNPYLDLDYYMERERQNWKNSIENYERRLRAEEGGQQDDEGDDEDS